MVFGTTVAGGMIAIVAGIAVIAIIVICILIKKK